MAGMVGGSVTALTGHMPAYVAFSVCTLVPYALRLAGRGRPAASGHGDAGRALPDRHGRCSAGRSAPRWSPRSGWRRRTRTWSTALREKSAQLEATFEHVNQGVAVFDRDGRLATWNPRHRELHGYPPELYRRGVRT